MHELPVQDAAERARKYREDLLGSEAWCLLKAAMDLWCACWFWPPDEIEQAPLPSNFVDPPEATQQVADRVSADMRFFHWELEFPDVYRDSGSGFDAILGNPPWDIAKPVSKEFFSNIDPLYRSYGKQEALRRQSGYFRDESVERDWLDYNARFRAQSNFMRNVRSPYGDPDENATSQDRFAVSRGRANLHLHDRWRSARTRSSGFADPSHPFRHQGSADINLYKLFLERSHALLRSSPSSGAETQLGRPAPDQPQTASVGKPTPKLAECESGGRLGFLVPSGLYSDHGTGSLRDLFLKQCRWEWLFGIENRDKVFPIDSRFKFNPLIIEKGGVTNTVLTSFMRRKLEDWEHAEDFAVPYSRAQIERFSPRSRAILEIQSARDLEILEKIYANGVLLGDDGPNGWGIRYAREFDMTNDSRLFPPRPRWEAKGYRPDEYSRWLLGNWRPIEELWEELGVDPSQPEPAEIELEDWLFDTSADPVQREAEARFVHGHLLKPGDVARTDWRLRCAQQPYDRLPAPRVSIPTGIVLSRNGDAWIHEDKTQHVALPFFEGRMIGQFDYCEKGWVSGKGRSAVWRTVPWERKHVEPQYLMGDEHHKLTKLGLKLAMMDITSSTNTRTMIVSPVARVPCGHSIGVLNCPTKYIPATSATLNSLVYDYSLRIRFSGLHTSWFVIEDTPLPQLSINGAYLPISQLSASLGTSNIWFLQSILANQIPMRILTQHERLRIGIILDVLIASAFELEQNELRHMLRQCDLPCSKIANSRLSSKGFWRVDKHKDPELRQTLLTLIAFHDLESKTNAADGDQEQGMRAFLNQNHGQGWMVPEALRLADYGLGHDERAQHPQPVASRLGPRFYDWQLVQGAEESGRECHLHARNLLGTRGYAWLIVDLIEHRSVGDDSLDPLADRHARNLLGEEGFVTALVEIRARGVLGEPAYWTILDDLQVSGDLDEGTYCRVLDSLRARSLIDELEYRRRRRADAYGANPVPLEEVAEPQGSYRSTAGPQGEQTDLFE